MTSRTPYAVYRYYDGHAVYTGSYKACRNFLRRTNGSFWLYVAKA